MANASFISNSLQGCLPRSSKVTVGGYKLLSQQCRSYARAAEIPDHAWAVAWGRQGVSCADERWVTCVHESLLLILREPGQRIIDAFEDLIVCAIDASTQTSRVLRCSAFCSEDICKKNKRARVCRCSVAGLIVRFDNSERMA